MRAMKIVKLGIVLSLAVGTTGCYRVAVATGRPPSGVVHEHWAHTFLYGLIGTDEAAPCAPAVVETRMSFVNAVVEGLTFGLWAPRTVRVVCAANAPGPAVPPLAVR